MAASTLLHNNLILMCKFSKRFSRGYKLHCAPITQDIKLAISRRQTWYRAPSCINWFRLHSRYSLSNCWMIPFHGDEDCETPHFPHNGVTRVLEMHSSSSVTMTAEMMRLHVTILRSESSFVFSAMIILLLSNAGSVQFRQIWIFMTHGSLEENASVTLNCLILTDYRRHQHFLNEKTGGAAFLGKLSVQNYTNSKRVSLEFSFHSIQQL